MSAQTNNQNQDLTVQLKTFVDTCKLSQQIWALQDPATNDYVICDSSDFEQTDVMPLWSEKSMAEAYCTDEWAGYVACSISVDDYLEQWVTDLNYDGVLIGLNCDVEQEASGEADDVQTASVEIDPIDVAKAFADCEIEYETQH